MTGATRLAPRPGVLDIEPYVGGRSRLDDRKRVIKLSANEGALGPSPRAVEAYKKAAAEMQRYPDGACAELRAAIGRRFGLEPERIVCGAGSDELLTLLARAYAGPGHEVLHTEHGFLMYPIIARSVGATPVAVPETGLKADLDQLCAKVTEKTRIVYLANPNNPTGSYLSADELERLRARLPDRVLLAIDAAYAEFVTRDDYAPGIDLVDGGDNVVMTRTFSKIFALAGLRLGWAYCPPGIAGVLNRLRMPFNVTAPAQAAGVAALEDVAFTDAARAHNEKWRDWLGDKLVEIGLRVYPSAVNFVLVRFPDEPARNARAAEQFLNAKGIIPRRLGRYGLNQCLRITVGLEHEMEAVADALAEFMA
ncbi:MAG: histidinol-phosphate transaminase [Alphaproteobacteria bacterium]